MSLPRRAAGAATRLLARGPARPPVRLPIDRSAFSTQSPRRNDTNAEIAPSSAAGTSRSSSSSNAGHAKAAQPEPSVASKMAESAATTFASILVLGLGFAAAGYIYHRSYKMLVINKMVRAFEPGDPVLDLATVGKDLPSPRAAEDERWIHRDEQSLVDAIVDGREVGHYYLMIGDKGTGKSSMLLEAMRKIDGDGVSMFEAHADLEVVRLRLGKALNYEFHEDYIGGYFSERGPRESTALLDIERALNKLEKVAMRLFRARRRPLILIVNQMHLLRDDDDGRDLIELLQQRAEQWAATNLVTIIFNSDDYWVYERLKQLATRMEVLPITDLPKGQAVSALKRYRQRYWGEALDEARLDEVYDRVGGRLNFLNKVAKSRDMLATCENIKEIEKRWFLNQCWILGMEMDDDVMDQQKWAAAAMVLAQALVAKEKDMDLTYDAVIGHLLPSFPFHVAQELMTRCDFIRKLDSLNLFSITSRADVRASSVPMHRAFREICGEPGFDEHLERTIQRIADIESLGRTRELVAKDLVLGGHYEIEAGRKGIRGGGGIGFRGPQLPAGSAASPECIHPPTRLETAFVSCCYRQMVKFTHVVKTDHRISANDYYPDEISCRQR
ncbi:ATPase domain, prokaryote [Cordyceps fumosorosea ARSEF 2679]|uniref:ATPase domain, prokaryote n=1 Tax=Cordyceps fumosorosea (strain ARSEF 2679) TaxID=1081104 RepID=A0A167Y9V6_CORFA|nr:ATPase domain, prokaryote [Cordyceps fumosorosea ARSEF 2679]OAA66039.1 ATPase domain, prokaryote [Cordyceps fumosorosea ARSEF 2679]